MYDGLGYVISYSLYFLLLSLELVQKFFYFFGAPSWAGLLDDRWMAFCILIFLCMVVLFWIAQGHSFNYIFNCFYLNLGKLFIHNQTFSCINGNSC